jgi:hypothetical protein
MEIVYILVYGIMVLYLAEIVFSSTIINIFKSGQFSMQITLGFVVSTFIAVGMGFGVYYYITKNSFELSKKNQKMQVLFVIGFSVLWTTTVLLKIFMGDTVLLTINCLYPIILLGVACIVIKHLNDKYANSFFKYNI